MNINQLVYFVTVVKYNNITKAAKELYISQPAISLAIKDLEKEFGLTLFKRKNNVLTLTQHGKYLYDLSMPLIQEYNNVNERMNDYINKHSTLNLGIPPMLGTFLFPPIFNVFANENSGFQFKIKEYGSFANKKAVLGGEIDIAFTVTNECEVGDELEYIKIGETSLIFAVNKNNPLASKKVISANDIKNTPLILMKEDSLQYQIITSLFKEQNITPNILLTSNQFYIIKELLQSSDNNCGAFIFKQLIKDGENIIGIQFEKELKLDVLICYKKDAKLLSTTKRFIEFIKNNIKL